MALKVYLDICSLKRPFDDQTQPRIHLESEAVLEILKQADREEILLASSEALELENARDPDLQRRSRTEELLRRMAIQILLLPSHRQRAAELAALGFKPMDALHIATAEQAEADAFISTDDGLLRAASRHADILKVRVLDPIVFIRSYRHEE